MLILFVCDSSPSFGNLIFLPSFPPRLSPKVELARPTAVVLLIAVDFIDVRLFSLQYYLHKNNSIFSLLIWSLSFLVTIAFYTSFFMYLFIYFASIY